MDHATIRKATLRQIKTRLQQAWEYIRKDNNNQPFKQGSILAKWNNPYRPALVAVELLWIGKQQDKALHVLTPYLEGEELAILTAQVNDGSL